MTNINKLFDLTGRTALITGGGTGIGKEMAKVLSEAGASVILCARRVDKLEQAAEEISANGGRVLCVPMDITDTAQVTAGFDAASDFGTPSIVVNNAGIVSGSMLLDLEAPEWDQIMATNLKGAWLVAKEAARRLIETKSPGSIINISSMLGSAIQQGTGPYAASKAALIHLTRQMALEWAPQQIRANSISPGYIATDMVDGFLQSEAGQQIIKRNPQARYGQVADLSGAILLLASDASGYMTGTNTVIDGGHSIPQI